MALKNENLGRIETTFDRRPRMVVKHSGVRTFSEAAGGPTLKIATPVYRDTADANQWKVWTNTQLIEGFVAHADVVLDASDQVLGNVMLVGDIHRDDVILPSGETQGNLDTALRATTLRDRGILVRGLDQVA